VIVQPAGKVGKILVKAEADGLKSEYITIKIN
jgi:hypothetical protein